MKSIAAFACAVLLCCAVAVRAYSDEAAVASDVIVLDDSNFEKLTQASTGATTGPWLVEFYAPWCGHCRNLAPTYEKVATKLKGVVNVAKVDATQATLSSKRFGVKGYPTILLINQGQFYKYEGDRSLDHLVSFASTDFAAGKGVAVPGEPTLADEVLFVLKGFFDWVLALHSKQTANFYILVSAAASVGFFIGVIFAFIIIPSPQPTHKAVDAAKKTD